MNKIFILLCFVAVFSNSVEGRLRRLRRVQVHTRCRQYGMAMCDTAAGYRVFKVPNLNQPECGGVPTGCLLEPPPNACPRTPYVRCGEGTVKKYILNMKNPGCDRVPVCRRNDQVYNNFDEQLGRMVAKGPRSIVDKMVEGARVSAYKAVTARCNNQYPKYSIPWASCISNGFRKVSHYNSNSFDSSDDGDYDNEVGNWKDGQWNGPGVHSSSFGGNHQGVNGNSFGGSHQGVNSNSFRNSFDEGTQVFNCQCYVNRYPDLRTAFGNDCRKLEKHWRKHGKKEGRNPSCSGSSSPQPAPSPSSPQPAPSPSSPQPTPSPSSPNHERSDPYHGLLSELVGFGQRTTGGKGGKVCKVTNHGDSGHGSLRHCVEQHGPTWIRFDIDGDIRLNSYIEIRHSDITIDGRGRSVTLRGNGLKVSSNNVIIAHLGFNGDGGGDDAIQVYGQYERIWIHRCSLSNYRDGLIDLTKGATDITVSWNKFTNHKKVMLIGSSDEDTATKNTRVTIHHNWFKGTNSRHPRVRYAKVHLYNNYYEKWGNYAVSCSQESECYSEKNLYKAGGSKNAIKTHQGGDKKHGKVESHGDKFENGAEKDIKGSVFKPSDFYGYSAESTSGLANRVTNKAGK